MTHKQPKNKQEAKEEFAMIWVAIGLIFILSGVSIMISVNNRGLIDTLPHKVCHNESNTVSYKYNLNYSLEEIYDACFPIDSEVLCDSHYDTKEYKSIGKICVFPNDNYDWGANRQDFDNGIFKYQCLIKSTKEVCEIK